jgi:hypothetical protein
MKICTNKDCKQINPQLLENYGKDSHTKDGLTYRCKVCLKLTLFQIRNTKEFKIKSKLYRERPKIKEYQRKYQKSSKAKLSQKLYRDKPKNRKIQIGKEQTIKYKYGHYRYSAKKYNRQFELTIEQFTFIISKPCSYCGEESLTRGIDRVDNSLGYIEHNSVSCCARCNRIKLTFSVKETNDHILKMLYYQKIIL